MAGTVYLVGAGPGDAGLLTLRAYELIKNADAVVYDRLVSDRVLELIPEGVTRINVGKNAGNHQVPQDEINAILVREAHKYRSVVRLKGGDPFVFGRGGEEAECLAGAGIRFEIVPGVTSAAAVPAYAGIPVTHRDFASSLHIITGHGRDDSEINLDFVALARFGGTLVFLMSVSTAPLITRGLLNAGMCPETPAAVVENGTSPRQRSFASTLNGLPDMIKREQIRSPAIIIVGGVCGVKDKLEWFTKRPLYGCRVLVTRPKELASGFGTKLGSLGAEVLYYPCIKTQPLTFDLRLDGLDWAVFTSAAGVNAFFARLDNMGLDSRALSGVQVAAVGTRTASALKQFGISADFVPAVFDGESLARGLITDGHIKSGQKAALFRAKEGGFEIMELLSGHGVAVTDVAVYETVYASDTAADLDGINYITFTSASCVKGFVRANNPELYTGIQALCIGSKTAAEAENAGMNVIVSDSADTDSMVSKLLEVYRYDNQTEKA